MNQTWTARLTPALGSDTIVWNIATNAEAAAGFPNNPHVPSGAGPWFEGVVFPGQRVFTNAALEFGTGYVCA